MCLFGFSTNRFTTFTSVFYLILVTCVYCDGTIFYTDEEEQQTRPLPISISGRKMDQFQTQVLDILDLKKPSGDTTVAMTDKLASHYMSHLYRRINREEGDQFSVNPNFNFLSNQLDNELNFDFEDIQQDSHASDTIVSFAPKEVLKRHASTNEILFNLSDTFQDLRLVKANLYLILDPANTSLDDLSIEAFSGVNSSRVDFDGFQRTNGSSIINLNITRIFSTWLNDLQNSQQLTVKLEQPDNQNDTFKFHCFGVGFFQEGDPQTIRRSKRSLSSNMVVEENWDETESQETVHEAEPIFSTKSQHRSNSPKLDLLNRVRPLTGRRCKVRSLYVDFKDLGWDAWVIAPTGYQADYCEGDCSFPLDSSLSPTNHAIVQTLVHLLDDRRALPAQCAPVAMKSQSILFFNNQRNVVMRRYHNMRVRQCGCK